MMDLPMPLKQCHRLDVRLDLDETGAPVVAAPGLSWELAAGEPNLVRGTVQIWRAQLDQAGRFRDQLSSVLSNEEYARAGRCQLEKERWRLIARRGLLRTILGHYLGVAPAQIRFTYGPSGKPALAYPTGTRIQFNLSHSEGLALFAVTRDGPVGIDVERVRLLPQAERIVRQFLSAREVAEWSALPGSRQPAAFLRYWTRLEACVKATGQGIAEALVEVENSSSAPGPGATLLATRSIGQVDYAVCNLTPARGYVAAMACHPMTTLTAKQTVSSRRIPHLRHSRYD